MSIQEWLPDELTNRGLRVAADPPRKPDVIPDPRRGGVAAAASEPQPKPKPPEPPKPAAPEAKAQSNGSNGATSNGAAAAPAAKDDPLAGLARRIAPVHHGLPDVAAEIEERLREAEHRVAQAAEATENRVARLHSLVRGTDASPGVGAKAQKGGPANV